MERSDAFWSDCRTHLEQARHHENLRAQAGAIITAAAGILAAFVAQNGIERKDLLSAIAVTVLGLLGFALTEIHSRLADEHYDAARDARRRLERELDISLEPLGGSFDRHDRKRRAAFASAFLPSHRAPVPEGAVRQVWLLINALIVALGVVLVCLASAAPSAKEVLRRTPPPAYAAPARAFMAWPAKVLPSDHTAPGTR